MEKEREPEVRLRSFAGLLRNEIITIIVIWVLLSLFSATQRYMDSSRSLSPIGFSVYLFLSFVLWSYWALATPLIFKLSQSFPLSRHRRGRAILAHFLFALLLGLLHIAFFSEVSIFFGLSPTGIRPRLLDEFTRGVRSFLYVDMIFYWAILGAGVARASSRESVERAMAAKELESQLGLARLQALKMQIQPHFLFNALNTVAMLIRNGEDSQAVKMVAGLGDLLRSSLDENPAQEIPLSSELDFIRRYLAIEEFRFPDRLRVKIDVPEELLAADVPNLILQPLVENAIRHGVARSSSAGLVRIAAQRQDGWLELSVHDDGPGLPPEWHWKASPGIGLKNTRVRLEQLYGSEQEFTIQNSEPTGAMVRLRIPFHQQSNNSNCKK